MQDLTKTWYTNDPDFTECFQKTALTWMPCAFLWLFSPIEIIFIKKSINRSIPRGFLNNSKFLLTALLIILSTVDLIIVAINKDGTTAAVDYCSPAIKIATLVSKKKMRVEVILKLLFFGDFFFSIIIHAFIFSFYRSFCWRQIAGMVFEHRAYSFCFGHYC